MTGSQKTVVTLAILLAVSLCGNAFLSGMVLTRGKPHPPFAEGNMAGPPRHEKGLRDFLQGVPPDARAQFSSVFKDDKRDVMQGMRQVMQFRRATADAIKAEPFDQAALLAALEAQRQAQLAVQADIHTRLAGVIATLDAPEREKVAQNARRLFK